MNNLSIRSILEKEKLNGNNFLDWYRNLRIVLRAEQKFYHLEEALPEAPAANASAAVRNAYTRSLSKERTSPMAQTQRSPRRSHDLKDKLETLKAFLSKGVNRSSSLSKVRNEVINDISYQWNIEAEIAFQRWKECMEILPIVKTPARACCRPLVSKLLSLHIVRVPLRPLASLLMPTPNQTINNSSIRSILEKEKLNGNNFLDWYRNLRIVLRAEQKFYHLEEDLPEAPAANASAAVRNTYTRRCNEQQEVACLMLASMIPELQKNLENLPAFDMLRELKVMFKQQAEQELFDTVRSFHACKQEEGQSVSSYVMKMKGYLDQMDRLGYPMPLILGVSLILTSLSKDYDQFVQNYNMHSMGKTIAELHNMLKLAEKGMPKKAPLVLAINQGRIQNKNKGKPQATGKGQGKGNFSHPEATFDIGQLS
ncbi:zinc finger, CCHC-type [Artemisia annua]|uniref:Zinc finger, CCHC-type n=1 Tax=Artemisia annua TaxID=35608 RepID=A0A2U1N667_ARTAN|nr:zinc finger, CCHC-type [Artemisia annua]